jgi:hypothetical protein
MFNNFNQNVNGSSMNNTSGQSKFANLFNMQYINDTVNEFRSKVSTMDQGTLNTLISQAKKFGLSDEQINQGIDIMNSIRRG